MLKPNYTHMKRRKNRLFTLSVAALGVALFGSNTLLAAEANATKANKKSGTKSQTATDSVTFELKYRGLTGKPNDIAYNSYWGFGGETKADNAFIAEVRQKAKDIILEYNNILKGAEWTAIELKAGKPVAAYMDLNADGKLNDNERLTPANIEESDSNYRCYDFVTPDFMLKGDNQTPLQFRALLTVRYYGNESRPNTMWSPACVMEGEAAFEGKKTKLVLFSSGFSGDFGRFGRARYAFLNKAPKAKEYIPRETLSSVINHEGQFYRLNVITNASQPNTLQVTFTKDTTPLGDIAFKAASGAALKAKLTSLSVTGAKDPNLVFNLKSGQVRMPAGDYKITRGYLNYGQKSDDEWTASFDGGPNIQVDATKACEVTLGKPVLTVTAVDQKDRYNSEVKDQSKYKSGTTIYLTRVVRAESGEEFGRFSKKHGNDTKDAKPHIKILDAKGKQILSQDMEYG